MLATEKQVKYLLHWFKEVKKNPINYGIDVAFPEMLTKEEATAIIVKSKEEMKQMGFKTAEEYIAQAKKDKVDHPTHYNYGIEAIDIIESWALNFNLGNVIKYTLRAPYKNDTLEDLTKARWYIDREINRIKSGKFVK